MFYEQNPDSTRFYQGDILADYPVAILPEIVKVVRFQEKLKDHSVAHVYEQNSLQDAFANGGEAILAKASLMNVVILSQTCDIEHREFVSIAPVFALTNVKNTSKREAVRNRKTFYLFYLPSEGRFPESFVDITTINSVRRATLNLEKRILALSHIGRDHLAYFIYNYFNRPFMPG